MTVNYYDPNSLSATVYDIVEGILRPAGPEIAFYRSLAEGVATPILDIGAGTGRIALPLVQDGHEVHALELSSAMLGVAGAKRGLLPPETAGRLHLHQGDMRSFDLDRRFDLVIVPYRVFNFLLDAADQCAFLRCLRRHLTPGGRAVIDTGGPPDLSTDAQPPTTGRPLVVSLAGTKYSVGWCLEGQTLDRPTQTVTLNIRYSVMTQAGDTLRSQVEVLRLRWLTAAEMPPLLEACGLRLLAEYGGFDLLPPAGPGDRLWLAAPAE